VGGHPDDFESFYLTRMRAKLDNAAAGSKCSVTKRTFSDQGSINLNLPLNAKWSVIGRLALRTTTVSVISTAESQELSLKNGRIEEDSIALFQHDREILGTL
jgi:hypothetical protein